MAWPVSTGFLAALSEPHEVVSRVEVLAAREVIAVLDATSDAGTGGGTVQVDRTADVRRRLESLEVIDPTGGMIPTRLGDPLTPPNELRVSRGIRYVDPAGVMREELVPLCVVAIDNPIVSLLEGAGVVRVDGYDRSATVSQRAWVDTFPITAGMPVEDALRAGLRSRLTWLRDEDFNFAPTGGVTPAMTWGGDDRNDPWLDFVDLARAHGHDLFFDPLGKPTLRPVRLPGDTATSRTYRPGETQTLTDLSRAFDVGRGENGVIVVGEGPDVVEPFRVAVWDTDPTSPTYYLGEWGARPRFLRSDLILTAGQGRLAAAAELAGMLGTPEDLRGSVVADSSLDVDDVIEVEQQGMRVNGRYVLDSLSVPVGLGDVEFTTRQQRRAA